MIPLTPTTKYRKLDRISQAENLLNELRKHNSSYSKSPRKKANYSFRFEVKLKVARRKVKAANIPPYKLANAEKLDNVCLCP